MPRSSPALCLYSDQMRKVGYSEMGQILGMLGFDGVEITVQTGGHVPLEGDIDLHLERSIEAMTGSGIEVPVVSTSLTTATNKSLQTIMWWASEMGVPIFQPGHWKIQDGNVAASAMTAQREIAWLAQLGTNTKLQVAIHNSTADFVGSDVAESERVDPPVRSAGRFRFRYRLRHGGERPRRRTCRAADRAAALEDGDGARCGMDQEMRTARKN